MNDALQREMAAMSNHLAAINARWNTIVDLIYDEWKAGDEKRPERKAVSPIQDINVSVQVP